MTGQLLTVISQASRPPVATGGQPRRNRTRFVVAGRWQLNAPDR
jgi:hypothetical protein